MVASDAPSLFDIAVVARAGDAKAAAQEPSVGIVERIAVFLTGQLLNPREMEAGCGGFLLHPSERNVRNHTARMSTADVAVIAGEPTLLDVGTARLLPIQFNMFDAVWLAVLVDSDSLADRKAGAGAGDCMEKVLGSTEAADAPVRDVEISDRIPDAQKSDLYGSRSIHETALFLRQQPARRNQVGPSRNDVGPPISLEQLGDDGDFGICRQPATIQESHERPRFERTSAKAEDVDLVARRKVLRQPCIRSPHSIIDALAEDTTQPVGNARTYSR
jgi:hypothetical protein